MFRQAAAVQKALLHWVPSFWAPRHYDIFAILIATPDMMIKSRHLLILQGNSRKIPISPVPGTQLKIPRYFLM